jgi:hypothetical protein
MRIETTDWIPAIEAGRLAGLDKATTLRLARGLGIVQNFFGVNVVRVADVATLRENRRRRGNQRWIESGEAAAADAVKGVRVRERRKKKAADSQKLSVHKTPRT